MEILGENLLFAVNIIVSVNGCLTKEISTKNWLKQKDLITHFLFLLVDESLNGLIIMDIEGDLL